MSSFLARPFLHQSIHTLLPAWVDCQGSGRQLTRPVGLKLRSKVQNTLYIILTIDRNGVSNANFLSCLVLSELR